MKKIGIRMPSATSLTNKKKRTVDNEYARGNIIAVGLLKVVYAVSLCKPHDTLKRVFLLLKLIIVTKFV